MSSHTPGHGQDQHESAHTEHNILTPHGKATIKKYSGRIGWLSAGVLGAIAVNIWTFCLLTKKLGCSQSAKYEFIR